LLFKCASGYADLKIIENYLKKNKAQLNQTIAKLS